MHLWQLIKDAWRTRSWKDRFRIWFMPTGWRPEDVRKAYPMEVIDDVYAYEKFDTVASPAFISWSWAQLVINLLLMYFLLVNIADLGFAEVALMTGFLFVSIFSYTTMMDKHRAALPLELLKFCFGFGIMYYFGGWFGMDKYLTGADPLMALYLLVSLLATVYFTYVDKPASGQKAVVSA
ncbi:MAG: hypothetical protein R3350_10410 [Saprospiraceae bacterium]|nr:hypothetical protein [Saprospiraceae bacterium]